MYKRYNSLSLSEIDDIQRITRIESSEHSVAVKKTAIPQNVVYQQAICIPHSGLICNNCKFLSFVFVALVW